MNRAFVKNDDGWQTCHAKMESCLFADENGKCILESCRFDEDKQPPADKAEK